MQFESIISSQCNRFVKEDTFLSDAMPVFKYVRFIHILSKKPLFSGPPYPYRSIEWVEKDGGVLELRSVTAFYYWLYSIKTI